MGQVKKLALFFLAVILIPVYAYPQVNVSGRVVSKASGEAIAKANVFFAYSMIGTTTDNDGNFRFSKVPEGDFELVISHIAFNNIVIEAKVDKDIKPFNIKLTPFKRALEEVTITDKKDKAWKRNFKKFKGTFLGATKNARGCEILNPWVVNFSENEKGTLSAKATDLIIINNMVLGYKISFLLQKFKMKRGTIEYSGKPKFERLVSETAKQEKKWRKNRLKTYKGSQRHFFASLVTNSLKEEGFGIYFAKLNSKKSGFEVTAIARPNNIIFPNSDGSTYNFHVSEFLRIIYTKEKEENNYISQLERPDNNSVIPVVSKQQTIGRDRGEKEPIDYRTSSFQSSYIFMRKKTMLLYSNGQPAYPEHIKEYGYWAWERVAELMPLDYVPE